MVSTHYSSSLKYGQELSLGKFMGIQNFDAIPYLLSVSPQEKH